MASHRLTPTGSVDTTIRSTRRSLNATSAARMGSAEPTDPVTVAPISSTSAIAARSWNSARWWPSASWIARPWSSTAGCPLPTRGVAGTTMCTPR
ncbi:MAG: hypothetical protein OEV40_18855, partial [Acidimicrobiia bacterium]|nr:hypothetical protein [Acidimicrobiia bacterium]